MQYEKTLLHQLQKPLKSSTVNQNSENYIQTGNGGHLEFRIIRV